VHSRTTAAAGHTKSIFYVHFSDRPAFLVALHRRFHDDVFSRIDESTAGDQPGPRRNRQATLILAADLAGCWNSFLVPATERYCQGGFLITERPLGASSRALWPAPPYLSAMGLFSRMFAPRDRLAEPPARNARRTAAPRATATARNPVFTHAGCSVSHRSLEAATGCRNRRRLI
jgi:AcrR family transcriptional regulator